MRPKHTTWVIFDTLNRDFCFCVRFHTLNKKYCVISSVILYPKQGPHFKNSKRGKSIETNLVTSSGHTRGLNERDSKKGLMTSPLIKFTYLFDLPTLFAYLAYQFCYPFF